MDFGIVDIVPCNWKVFLNSTQHFLLVWGSVILFFHLCFVLCVVTVVKPHAIAVFSPTQPEPPQLMSSGGFGNTGLWGLATGFGAANTSLQAPASSFGTLAPAAGANAKRPAISLGSGPASSGGLFGNSTTSNPSTTTGGGLFGNSASNNAANSGTSGGLFGNTATNASNTASGGLFGNSGASTAKPGGLFGNTATSTAAPTTGGGLFGNSGANNTAASGGLFGNSTTSAAKPGGLFGNTGANTTTTGGLFGNNTSTAVKPAGGLFGNSTTSNTASGGLFGNTTTNNTTSGGGLFGNSSKPATGGLFGNSAQPATGGLFGNTATNATGAASSATNPYGAPSLLSLLTVNGLQMPKLLTQDLHVGLFKDTPKKRKFSYLDKLALEQTVATPSNLLLKRLGKTLRTFRQLASLANPLRGLFSTPTPKETLALPTNTTSLGTSKTLLGTKGLTHTRKFQLRLRGGQGSLKRLIIKLKPIKYHLINANRVLLNRRPKLVDTAPGALANARLVVDEDEEIDDEDNVDAKIEGLVRSRAKSLVVFAGNLVPAVPDDTPDKESYTTEEDSLAPPLLPLDYYIYPLLSEIVSHPHQVEDLVIGRKGHLKIAWARPVDLLQLVARCQRQTEGRVEEKLANELIDNVVRLHGTVVEVYNTPGYPKPPMSHELNVPAVISVENVRPKPDQLVHDFIAFLKKQTGMEFLTYDPHTAIWTFRVLHFSVWGLLDDSADASLRQLKQQQDAEEDQLRLEYSRVYEQDQYRDAVRKAKVGIRGAGVPGHWDAGADGSDPSLPLLVKQRQVAEQVKLNVIRAKPGMLALVREADTLMDLEVESEDEVMGEVERIDDEAMLVLEPVDKTHYLRQLLLSTPYADMAAVVDEKAYEPTIDDASQLDRMLQWPDLPTTKLWLVQLELADDYNSLVVPTPLEVMAAPIDRPADIERQLFPADILRPLLEKTSLEPAALRDTVKAPLPLVNGDDANDLVDEVRCHARIEPRSQLNFPVVTGYSAELSFAALSRRCVLRDSVLYQLALALFDPVPIASVLNDPSVELRLAELGRQQRVVLWLKEYNRKYVDDFAKTTSDSLAVALWRLCAGDLEGAIAAIPTSSPHLRAVLVLADAHDEAARTFARNQLDDWATRGQANIPEPVVHMWQIIAQDFAPTETMPWLLQLATRLRYGDNSQPLSVVLGEVETKNSLSVLMKAYHLLALDPSAALTYIAESGLDIKFKWTVFQVCRNYSGDFTNLSGDGIAKKFAHYLNLQRLYVAAVFVILTITKDADATTETRSIILDHIKDMSDEDVATIITQLNVPQALVLEARGRQLGDNGDYWQQCQYYIDAQLWNDANDVILNHLGPEVVTTATRGEELIKLTAQILQNGFIIQKWTQGGDIYVNYAKLMLHKDELVVKPLLDNLPFLQGDLDSRVVKVARAIMARTVGDAALAQGESPLAITKLPLAPVDANYFRLRLQ